MATINSPAIKRLEHFGEYGNAAQAVVTTTLVAAAIADVVRVAKLEAGTTVTGIRFRTSGLGTGVTISLGYQVDEETTNAAALLAATAAAAAANVGESSARPLEIAEDTYITATIAGGAATGDLDVIVDYIFDNQ